MINLNDLQKLEILREFKLAESFSSMPDSQIELKRDRGAQ
jgi:hypothetical protein